MNPSTRVGEVLRNEIWTLTPDTGVASALRLAEAEGLRHLLVLKDGVLAGVVSRSVLRRARASEQVASVMRSPVLCVLPETTVGEASQIFQEQGVGFLPVVSGATIVGYVDEAAVEGEEDYPAAAEVPAAREPN